MLRSKDGIVEIKQANSIGSVIWGPAAWSIVNIPVDEKTAEELFFNLYWTATSRHVLLSFCRHKRKERHLANKNLPNSNWSYLETVSIWYERPSTCSNNGFLPLAEPAWIFYKGDTPDTKKTGWFSSGEYNNATNLWNVSPQEGEDSKYNYYQRFNWETNLLLMNLADPLEHKRFIYTLPLDKSEQNSLFTFCHKYGMSVCLFAESYEESSDIMRNYNAFLESK